MSAAPLLRRLALVLLPLALLACDRARWDMITQPRLGPGDASPLFPDHKATRPPPPGSVVHAMGVPAATSSGRRGTDEVEQRAAAYLRQALPVPVPLPLIVRGRERYDIYCLPCHSPVGDGDGPVVRRGFPSPPSFHQPRLRAASDRHFFDVITHGYGVMYPYDDRVAPDDRWAIVAYIRALQLSQHAEVAALPPDLRAAVDAGSADAPAHGANAEPGAWRPVPGSERSLR